MQFLRINAGDSRRSAPLKGRLSIRHLVIGGCFTLWVTLAHVAPATGSGSQTIKTGAATNEGSKPSIGDNTGGEELYKASCVVCHGPRATGGIGPRLAGNPILSNDQAFWKIVHEGRHVMPPLKGMVTDQQIADIRAWLRTLQ